MAAYGIKDVSAFNRQKREMVDLVHFTLWRGLLLDLTYLTPNLAVMCTPTLTDPIRRNDARIVADYVHEACGAAFCLVNLHERCYDYALFDNLVLEFPFPDHCSPRLSFLLSVVTAMEAVRAQVPNVTFFVHCKAGRGRSCTVALCHQLFVGAVADSNTAIAEVNVKRSPKGLSISVPSQKRFLRYFELIAHAAAPPPQKVRIFAVEFAPPLEKPLEFRVTIGIPFIDPANPGIPCDGGRIALAGLVVEGEFSIELHAQGEKGSSLRCQLHSAYLVDGIEKVDTDESGLKVARFEKHELDGPHHRRHGKNFPDGFTMSVHFEDATE
jgi:hypothetical protein